MFNIKSRQVHMDFHLSGELNNVGENFNRIEFIDRLKKSNINAITVFAKCHHGWFYYFDSKYSVHPGLKKDLLPEMLTACADNGIETAIYMSAGFDEVMAERHHDWIYKLKDSSTEWAKNFEEPGYHMMCFNGEYTNELCRQTEEVMKKFAPREIFFDICTVKRCYCEKCRKDMAEKGINIDDDNAVERFAEEVYERFCEKTTEAIRKYSKDCRIFYNGGHIHRGRRKIAEYNTHFEIESLPTGGWGYEHFPMTVNYLEQFGKDYLGMTGKFNTSWAEFGGYKDPNALLYEVGLFMCYGAKCSIGDQINYDGTLDEHTYDIIGKAYEYVSRYEKYVYGTEKRVEIGVLSIETSSVRNNPSTDRGIIKILLKGRYQFDFIDEKSDVSKYKLIILPDAVVVKGKLKEKIDDFCACGGKLLISGESAVENGKFLYDVGAEFIGKDAISPSYLACENITGVHAHNVIYSESFDVKAAGAVLANKYKPLMNRVKRHFCSHQHWPENTTIAYPGITEGKDGAYIAFKVFEDFANFAPCEVRKLLIKIIDGLLCRNKLIDGNLPTQAIATLRNNKKENKEILQILYAIPYNAGGNLQVIDDIPQLYNTEIVLSETRECKNIVDADGNRINFVQNNGKISFIINTIYCHKIIQLEF